MTAKNAVVFEDVTLAQLRKKLRLYGELMGETVICKVQGTFENENGQFVHCYGESSFVDPMAEGDLLKISIGTDVMYVRPIGEIPRVTLVTLKNMHEV